MSTTMQRLSGSISAPSVLTGRLGIAFLAAPTGDATAAVTDILAPKTAYIATGKVTGTCTFDSDTSDATAAASDILLGETAYAGGEKLTGTLTLDTLIGDPIPQGIITSVDVNLRVLTVDHYGASVLPSQYGSNSSNAENPYYYMTAVVFKNNIVSVGVDAFKNCIRLVEVSLPASCNSAGSQAFMGCSGLTSFSSPGITAYASQLCYGDTALTTADLGSIGNPVTSISTTFQGCTQMGLTITIYVTPDTHPLNGSPWGATNATIVYKSAVDGSVL